MRPPRRPSRSTTTQSPGVYDLERALDPDAPAVHEGGNLLAEWAIDRGDIAEAFEQADAVVEGEYYSQFVDHAYLEPEAGMAYLDDEGVITMRVATQVVEHYRDVAKVLDLPHSRVRVLAPFVGGGFGGKEDMTIEPYLGLAVYHTKRPVRMGWTRQESLLARPKRHPMLMRYRTAATATGDVVAQESISPRIPVPTPSWERWSLSIVERQPAFEQRLIRTGPPHAMSRTSGPLPEQSGIVPVT